MLDTEIQLRLHLIFINYYAKTCISFTLCFIVTSYDLFYLPDKNPRVINCVKSGQAFIIVAHVEAK